MKMMKEIKNLAGKKSGFWKKESGGKEVLVEVGLAVVAITLLLVFKTAIGTYMETMMTSMTNAMTKLFTA